MTGPHFAVVFLFFVSIAAQHEGEQCIVKQTGANGECRLLDNCNYAKDLLRSGQRPQLCGFRGIVAIVCCPLTTKRIPGQKSAEECSRYYLKTIRVDPHGGSFGGYGGEFSLSQEFPHMAILGYGNKDDIKWLCGGSLISEQFVLTAAHCVISKNLGVVKRVRLGDLDIKSTTDDAQPLDFSIVTHFVHPAYRSSSHYHDIALLRLDRNVTFNSYMKPACMYNGTNISKPLIATGWGQVDFFGEPSSHLIKVYLDHVPFEKCAEKYSNTPTRRLASGILDELQTCAGSLEGRDTCPGDSGGPLQFRDFQRLVKEYKNMSMNSSVKYYVYENSHYHIVGVTSFGKPCGFSDIASAGVYTRVSRYIDWIEDIVWPLN